MKLATIQFDSKSAKQFAAVVSAMRKNVTAQDSTRPVLEALHLRNDNGKLAITGADGFVLMTVNPPVKLDDGNWDVLSGNDSYLDGYLLYPEDCDALVANLKLRAKTRGTMFLEFVEADHGVNIVINQQTIGKLSGEGTYPNYDQLYETSEKDIDKYERFALNPGLLSGVLAVFKAMGADVARFRATGTTKPAWLEAGGDKDSYRAKCLAMPMFVRWEDQETGGERTGGRQGRLTSVK